MDVNIIFRMSQKPNIKVVFFYVKLDAARIKLDANWLTSNVCAKNRPRKFNELLGPSRSVSNISKETFELFFGLKSFLDFSENNTTKFVQNWFFIQ